MPLSPTQRAKHARIYALRNPEEEEGEEKGDALPAPPFFPEVSPGWVVVGVGMNAVTSGIVGGAAGSLLRKGFGTGFAIGATSSLITSLLSLALKASMAAMLDPATQQAMLGGKDEP